MSLIGTLAGLAAPLIGRFLGAVGGAPARAAVPAGFVTPFVGPPAPVAAVPSLRRRTPLSAGRGVQRPRGAAVQRAAAAPVFERQGEPCPAGGNGTRIKTTIVETTDEFGNLICFEELRGAPFLMQRDLAIAKRVLRTAAKLGTKFSRKGRKQSKRGQLLDAIEETAIRKALGVDCPT